MSAISRQLRELRRGHGLTQRELAQQCDIVQPVIAAYESGARDPGLRSLERISGALGAHVELVPLVRVGDIHRDHPELRRDQLLSLVLHYDLAARLVRDPNGIRSKSASNIATMRRADPRGAARSWLDRWAALLTGPLGLLLSAMIDPSSDGDDLRQCSPFAGVMDERVRQAIIREVRRVWQARPVDAA